MIPMMIADETKQWLDLVKYQPVAFGLESGFEDLVDLHNEWIKKFLTADDDLTLQAHRGSFKTTCLAIAIALMIIVYPSKNIIMVRKADDDVKEIITQIATLLQTDIFVALSQGLHGKQIQLTKRSAFEIDTNLKATARGASQLLGIGSKASITGKHADIVITDDIINIDDRLSRAHRERTKMTYQELQNVKNRGGRFINTGTPWHKEDAFTLMPNVIKYDVYSTDLTSKAEIQNLRNSMTPSLFAANYELKHIADEDTLFSNATIDDGSNTELIYDGLAHIDASYGGEDGTAFTIAKKQPDGKIYVFGQLWEKHVDDCLSEIAQYHEHYRAGSIYAESNADKGYLSKQFNDMGLPTNNYHEKQNKFIKISTYLRKHWGNIIFIDRTDKDYINQVLEYTENAEHDDAPDSLASIVRVLSNSKKKPDVNKTINRFKRLGF